MHHLVLLQVIFLFLCDGKQAAKKWSTYLLGPNFFTIHKPRRKLLLTCFYFLKPQQHPVPVEMPLTFKPFVQSDFHTVVEFLEYCVSFIEEFIFQVRKSADIFKIRADLPVAGVCLSKTRKVERLHSVEIFFIINRNRWSEQEVR